jgi:hypothetical protein
MLTTLRADQRRTSPLSQELAVPVQEEWRSCWRQMSQKLHRKRKQKLSTAVHGLSHIKGQG